MPRKHQKPLGIVPLGGFAVLPKLPREAVDSLSDRYGLPADDLAIVLCELAAEWRMDVSVYSAATNPNVARAFERLTRSAEQLRQAWEYIERNIHEGTVSVQGAILELAARNGLTKIGDFRQWLIFLSELAPEQLGRQAASPRQRDVYPLRRLLNFLSEYWLQQKGTSASAYWSDMEETMKTNEGGDFVSDAAELITGTRPTPDQLREAFREAADAATGDDPTPAGDDPAP